MVVITENSNARRVRGNAETMIEKKEKERGRMIVNSVAYCKAINNASYSFNFDCFWRFNIFGVSKKKQGRKR